MYLTLLKTTCAVLLAFPYLLSIGGCVRNTGHSSKSTAQIPQNERELSQQTIAAQYNGFLGDVRRAAAASNLENLKDKQLAHSETEVRIWAGFDLTQEKCFLLRKQNERLRAWFVVPKLTRTRSDPRPRIIVSKIALRPPQSGWEEFQKFLEQEAVFAPEQYSLDEIHTPTPDERWVVLERKSGTSYAIAFFPISTSSRDGKKLIQACERIEKEFGINIRCK